MSEKDNKNLDELKKAAAKPKKNKDNKEVIKLKEANALLNEKIIHHLEEILLKNIIF